MKIQKIDLNKIEQNENSRVVYKEADLSELMHSMKQDGLLQPVGVMKTANGKYEAVFGNRRIVAAKKLGWADIDANVLDLDSENARDFTNLIENLKRQNVSVTEEGRLYSVLVERGLSISEIAARLAVNKIRVEVALDAMKNVPAEFAKRVVNRISGNKTKGTISATAYHTISNLRKSHSLNRPQFRSLLSYAADESTSTLHLHNIAPLLKMGSSLKEAIAAAERFDRIALTVFIPSKLRSQIEKKTGKSVIARIYELLEADSEMQLSRRINNNYNTKPRKMKTILRKSAERATA